MNEDKKHRLRNIALLVLVGLIGGTFAFAAFNQQAINDRLRENPAPVGARVHDYFNRQTENKDVFVENYGQEPIMARIRLSEFMEYQKRGQTGWIQVAGGDRHDSSTWTIYRPEEGDINSRSAVDGSSNFTQYSTLTFGWERDNQEEPWYLPTFNHDSIDLTTAAAGDAQDYLERGATHPGDGKDNFWQANVSYTNGQNDIVWPGSTEGTRTTSQNLRQERNPITLQEWRALRTEAENDEVGRNKQIGNFWVMDPETGWAYWANRLNPGQATSYLIDEARMEDAARAIQGSYYYAIHVDSELINVSAERFSHEDQASEALEELLDRIRVGADGNASPQFPAPVRDFTFSTMRDTAGSNRIFTVDSPGEPQEFRYLENMEGGYHWIISNSVLTYTSWYEQEDRMDAWFDEELSLEFRALVAPVAESFSTGDVHDSRVGGTTGGLQISGTLLSITNLSAYPEVAADRTRVVSEAEGGIPSAFALSVADVQYLTFGTSSGFANNLSDRMAASPWPNIWWLRTPATYPLFPQLNSAWTIAAGTFTAASGFQRSHTISNLGARPALIIHQ
ncbi:hypothetical protein [Lactococcus petauri]|uniref:Uncharacterized protein n=1 Tax=Lactococcus petauri TaxID=1940789 RepID=A0A252CDY8_9LACT|nr:hypothetical protein [Lactococcus petauri]OUK04771.1 hypothetical protein BZZ03_03110 [Lactococcus petauri]